MWAASGNGSLKTDRCQVVRSLLESGAKCWQRIKSSIKCNQKVEAWDDVRNQIMVMTVIMIITTMVMMMMMMMR